MNASDVKGSLAEFRRYPWIFISDLILVFMAFTAQAL